MGAWWVWDAQLTLTLVLWLIFVAYFMLRTHIEDPVQNARFRAVLGIVGFLNVPFIHYATKLWRTHHPEVVRGEEIGPATRHENGFLFLRPDLFYALFRAALQARIGRKSTR